MDKNYGGVVWTNHSLQRLKERGISQGDAWATWKSPDQSRPSKTRGSWIYYKTYKTNKFGGNTVGEKIEVVAKQNERKEWLILSVWSRPVYNIKNTEKGGFWKLILRVFWGGR